jgi:hypothetical protein
MVARRLNQHAKKITSPYLENYDYHWGFASFHNKTVLDIGADYGSTASYFLQNGARRVIAVESNVKHFSKLVAHFRGNPLVTAINLEIREPQQIESLITKFKPDILKADCEGCELYLIKVEENALKAVPEFLIETHDHILMRPITSRMERLFRKLGYSYATYEVIPSVKGKLKVKILHAKRKWTTLKIREDEIERLKTSLGLKTQEESLRLQKRRSVRILETASGPLAILLLLYSEREDLRRAFPEVRDGNYSRFLLWARYIIEERIDAYNLIQPYEAWIKDNPIADLEILRAELAATKAELAAIKGSVGFRFVRFYSSGIDKIFQRGT